MKITTWRLMVTKLQAKFIPVDYELNLFKRLKNLKQKDMNLKDYNEEFYKSTIQFKHREISKEKVVRYINGLRFNIQDEIGMLKIDSVDDSYQYALRAKDKLKRRHQGNSQGKHKLDHLVKKKLIVEDEQKPIKKKKRMGKVAFKGDYLKCGEEEYRDFECPHTNKKVGDRRVVLVNEIGQEEGNFLIQQVLLGKKIM